MENGRTEKVRLSDKISQQIRADILSGLYAQGTLIPAEPELMKRYAVGRSTIREAIKALSIAGVLQVKQGRGTTVSSGASAESIDSRLRRADLDEINAVRSLLDREIVTLAVSNRTEQQLKAMKDALDQRRQAIEQEDRAGCMDADIAFHVAIARASANGVLADLYEGFTSIIRDFFDRRDARGIGLFAISHHLHDELYQAIRDQKSKLAQTLMQKILDNNY
jgi:DNA-binding FadR family transcriptional regulator